MPYLYGWIKYSLQSPNSCFEVLTTQWLCLQVGRLKELRLREVIEVGPRSNRIHVLIRDTKEPQTSFSLFLYLNLSLYLYLSS